MLFFSKNRTNSPAIEQFNQSSQRSSLSLVIAEGGEKKPPLIIITRSFRWLAFSTAAHTSLYYVSPIRKWPPCCGSLTFH